MITDPTAAPTRADAAFNNALGQNERFDAAIKDATALLAIKLLNIGDVCWCPDHVARARECNQTPTEYLAECLGEIAGDAFVRPDAPERAADDVSLMAAE